MANTYFEMLDAVKNYYGAGSDQWVEIAKYGIQADNAESILSQVPGIDIIKNSDGTIRSYTYKAVSSTSSGSSIAEEINSNIQSGTASVKNTTKIQVPSDMGVDDAGKLTFKSGLKTTGQFVMGSVVPAIAAAGVGISLGKTIDKTLYNLNPDFWDSRGMSALNPDTWNTITSGDSSIGASVFNMVFGIDGNDTQAYIDENAYAYLAYYMYNKGVFATGIKTATTNDPNLIVSNATYPFEYSSVITYTVNNYERMTIADAVCITGTYNESNNSIYHPLMIASSKNPDSEVISDGTTYSYTDTYTYDDKTVYYITFIRSTSRFFNVSIAPFSNGGSLSSSDKQKIAWVMQYGVLSEQGAIEGIGTQDSAVLPDFTGIETPEEALTYLKEKYPELWLQAVEQDVVQPDGTIKKYTYVPIPTPEGTSGTDEQPISGNASQADPIVNPETSTEPLLDLIIDLITTPPTDTDIPDTGSGDTPEIVIPAGSANALYAVYNPSQAELNSFGSWLWSTNFVDQILKLFNDPMQAIIGLHKVYASPGISGASTIKVGYLDSGVSANVVGSQYTTVSCGSVSLPEYFGNVFDYDPFTKVHLYLPFIGIVQLNTGDVMRSTISITYHVDVITGACLAEVNVKRDASGGVLYTYTGNCAVQYPISSGSYMGIVSSLASVAGGVVGTIATGGALAPLALGAVSGIMNAHTNVSHSGNFSGNAGAMGCKIPYLIITRPQTNLANSFDTIDGYPANYYTTISACSGFFRCHDLHIENIPATDSELDEIYNLLKQGVIK